MILPLTLRCQERQGLAQLQHDFNPCFSQTRSALFLPLRSGHSILTSMQGAMQRGWALPVPDQDGPADVPAKPGLASARDPKTRGARHGATANVGHRAIPRIPRADPSWISEANMAQHGNLEAILGRAYIGTSPAPRTVDGICHVSPPGDSRR